jgi:hypothetical protein
VTLVLKVVKYSISQRWITKIIDLNPCCMHHILSYLAYTYVIWFFRCIRRCQQTHTQLLFALGEWHMQQAQYQQQIWCAPTAPFAWNSIQRAKQTQAYNYRLASTGSSIMAVNLVRLWEAKNNLMNGAASKRDLNLKMISRFFQLLISVCPYSATLISRRLAHSNHALLVSD